MIPTNTIILATDDSDDGVSDARSFIKAQAYTGEDVRLVWREGQALVIAKRPVDTVPWENQ
jgi:hypothetical protein